MRGLSILVALALLGLAQTPTKPPLPSSVFEWSKLPVKKTATGERRDLFDSPTSTLGNLESHVTTLDPGREPHAEHRHSDDELVILKEGTMEIRVNGKAQQAGPGSVWFFAANDLHGMKNIGTTRASYYVIRIVR